MMPRPNYLGNILKSLNYLHVHYNEIIFFPSVRALKLRQSNSHDGRIGVIGDVLSQQVIDELFFG